MDYIQQTGGDYVRGGTQKDQYGPDEVVDVPCPYCSSERREAIYREHGSIGIVRCQDCELIFTSPRIKSPEQVYWGDGSKYLEEARLIFTGKLPHHRDPNYAEELDEIARFKPTGRFLDVGCNMGFLLRKARERGWDTFGVEPSPTLSKIAREKWGHRVHNCFLNEVPASEARSFDVVAFSDVFEHITEPLAFLGDASRLLKDDGVLYVKVPNARFSLFKQRTLERLGRRPGTGLWDSYEHVVHYTEETLGRMLAKGGFAPIHWSFGLPVQTPVWHDLVGHYFQYPSPWIVDWRRRLGRAAFYWLGFAERALRGGKIGALPQSLVVVARKGERAS